MKQLVQTLKDGLWLQNVVFAPVSYTHLDVYKRQAQGNVSAPVHAPTSGEVSAIGEITAPHPSGLAQLAITITADGADAWCERLPVADPFALAPEEIARRTAAAGVVGLGGATFPAAVKFNLGRRLKVTTLIVNCLLYTSRCV